MPTPSPFSAYASNFLNRSFLPTASVASTSQPLFYSLTDGSQAAPEDLDLDDDGDPHLRSHSGDDHVMREDEEDPYLDEEDLDRENRDSIPLIASELPPKNGWLAHREASPSPPPSSSSSSSSGSPPAYLLDASRVPTPPPTRTTLTESLLPRDGVSKPLFTLPEPGRIPRRKYNDFAWTALWCASLTACGFGFLLVLFLTHVPSKPPAPAPYSTLTHAVPLISLLTLLSSVAAYVHLALLRHAVRPALMVTAIAIPAIMVFSGFWAFIGSFFWDGTEGTWGETVGLRLFSLVPLVFAALSARSLYAKQHLLQQTIAVTELSTSILLTHPAVLLLSPLILIASFIVSFPFLTLIFRLLLVGYFGREAGGYEWHVRPYAGWLAFGASLIWLWSWCIARGVMRVVAAGVVGSWYFTKNPVRNPTDYQTTAAAFARATGPSLGSICVASLLLTGIHIGTGLLHAFRRVTTPPALPPVLHPLTIPVSMISSAASSLSSYALVYTGISGDPFFPSARRSRALTTARGPRARSSYTLLSTLFTLCSLSIGGLAAIAAYLFTAHSLQRPGHAPLSALLAGAVTFLVNWFCLSLVDDVADSLYMCYCIDLDVGTKSKQEVFEAFEGRREPAAPGLV